LQGVAEVAVGALVGARPVALEAAGGGGVEMRSSNSGSGTPVVVSQRICVG